ncbi:hypothetical protein Pcinc_001812 [Petrolisthes cinctipes]|uniref:Uncharacterized protein n=1 Tax=Petrolisthes cinctipes TaxID=88211 RepID=A0AAE1GM81_PETCI|nr:hypothetical protein Pcinc_001812 [Petrolisthes cinctipes]
MPRFSGVDYNNKQKEGVRGEQDSTTAPDYSSSTTSYEWRCWWWRYQGRINHSLSAGGSTSTEKPVTPKRSKVNKEEKPGRGTRPPALKRESYEGEGHANRKTNLRSRPNRPTYATHPQDQPTLHTQQTNLRYRPTRPAHAIEPPDQSTLQDHQTNPSYRPTGPAHAIDVPDQPTLQDL